GWRRWLGPLAPPGKRLPRTKKHEYTLTVSYEAAGETRNAVFQHQNQSGLTKVELFAGVINSLVRATKGVKD
ncbi:MAG TPA: hypothetical protein VJQ56_03415, partial [Blastocatellia bacterium]|nr:hypothetical protein [Blastocatellia bacterium]